MKILFASVALLGGIITTGADVAHHSFAAEFDRSKPIELTGIVTNVKWSNPHVWFYVNVRNAESGKMENWGVELGPPHMLQDRGWRRETLVIGTQVTVNASMSRNGSLNVNASSVMLTATGGAPGEALDAASSSDQE
jgi:hypothetical protein